MFTWDTAVRYSQLGPEGTLSPIAVLDLFQDIATMHAHGAGQGPEELAAAGKAWVLSRWRVRLGALPRCGQAVRVGTRAYDCRKALCRRAFVLTGEGGASVAEGDSLWVLIDTRTGGPTDAESAVRPYLEPGSAPLTEGLPRKAVTLSEEAPALESVTVTGETLDSNRHMNNARSAGLAMGRLPRGTAFSGMALDYHLPLLLGQVIGPRLAETPRGWAVTLWAGGQACLSAEFIR